MHAINVQGFLWMVLAGMLMALPPSGLAEPEMREWTSASGDMVRASLVRHTGNLVVLERRDGQQIQILMSQLSESDQAYLQERSAPAVEMPTPVRRTGSTESRILLTEEQIEGLATRDPEQPEEGERYVLFRGTASGARPTSLQQSRGRIPFRVTVQLLEITPSAEGRPSTKRMGGIGRIYVLNDKGEVVDSVSRSLERLVPERFNRGGYEGEVSEPGEYTFVMYVEYRGKQFGRVQKITL
jgi:hypothetical protein